MRIKIAVIGCVILALFCFLLISDNLALYNEKSDTPYEFSIDLLNNLKSNNNYRLDRVYENAFSDGYKKKEFADQVYSFAKSNSFENLKFEFEPRKTYCYSIYHDMDGNVISYDQWRKLEEDTMNKVMKESGFDDVNNKRTKAGLGASQETLDKFFELADKAVIKTDKLMPQPEKIFEDRVYVKISSQKESLNFLIRKTDTGYYLSRDVEPYVGKTRTYQR